MSDKDPTDTSEPDPYRLARQSLARAKDTARSKGFRPGKSRPTSHRSAPASHPNVTPGRGRDPAEVTSSLEKLISIMGWRQPLTVSSVLGRWPELVGEEVAAHCTPETFSEGELVLRTDSTAWASQLRYLLPQIERRLEEELGEGVVTKIQVLGPNLGRRKGRWTVPGRGPRDTYG